MFAILRDANGRRHEVDFEDDPVFVDVSMSTTTVQITMTAADPAIPSGAATSPSPCRVTRLPPQWRRPPLVLAFMPRSECVW